MRIISFNANGNSRFVSNPIIAIDEFGRRVDEAVRNAKEHDTSLRIVGGFPRPVVRPLSGEKSGVWRERTPASGGRQLCAVSARR